MNRRYGTSNDHLFRRRNPGQPSRDEAIAAAEDRARAYETRGEKTDPTIEMLVTQIVARDIAAGVELARSIGHAMPTEFDIGVTFIEDGAKTRIRMRLDDVTYDSLVVLAPLDGSVPLRIIDDLWKSAWERIHADALTVAQIWIDRHPEVILNNETAIRALTILDAMASDEDLHARWMKSCTERAKHFKYTVQPRRNEGERQ